MIKRFSLLVVIGCVFVAGAINAQSFEGVILYQNKYQSKIPNVSNEQLSNSLGSKQKELISSTGDYKNVFNGGFIKEQLYKSDENKAYTLLASSDIWYYEDYGKNRDKALSFEFSESVDTILGLNCNVISVKTETGYIKFFFNDKYKIDPELYNKHLYGNWYYIISKTKSIPLKVIYDTPGFTMISEAVSVEEQELNEADFKLPINANIAPANW
jgi:hypothetical protein